MARTADLEQREEAKEATDNMVTQETEGNDNDSNKNESVISDNFQQLQTIADNNRTTNTQKVYKRGTIASKMTSYNDETVEETAEAIQTLWKKFVPTENTTDGSWNKHKKEILETLTGTTTFQAFWILTDLTYTLQVVHSINKYAGDSCEDDPDAGKILGCTGERHGEVPGTHFVDMKEFVERRSTKPATLEELTDWLTDESTRFAAPSDVRSEKIITMCPLPNAWVTELITVILQPHEALEWFLYKIKNFTEDDGEKVRPMLTWLRALCTARSDDDTISVLTQTWRSVTITENMYTFMKGRLDTSLGQKETRELQLQHETGSSMTMHGSVPAAMEDFFESLLSKLNQLQNTSHTAEGTLVTTDREDPKRLSGNNLANVLAFAGLNSNEEDALPKVWDGLLKAKKTQQKRQVLLLALKKSMPRHIKSNTHVPLYLVRHITNLDLGFGLQNTHATCHEGMSPWAIIQLEESEAQEKDDEDKACEEADQKSISDIRRNKKGPPAFTPTCENLVHMLTLCTVLLEVLFGKQCKHLVETTQILDKFQYRYCGSRKCSKLTIVSILWQIFLDSRRFFSCLVSEEELATNTGTRPVSDLASLAMFVGTGVHMAMDDMPASLLIAYKLNKEETSEKHDKKETSKKVSFELAKVDTCQRHNLIINKFDCILRKYGSINVTSLAAHAGHNMTTLLPSYHKQNCLRFILTGQCNWNCTSRGMRHPQRISDELARIISERLGKGVTEYMAKGPMKKARK